MSLITAAVQRLVDRGVGVGGTTIFAGTDVDLPTTGTPAILTLLQTGGEAPVGTQNDGPGALRKPRFQATARADRYDDALALAEAAWAALGGTPHDPTVPRLPIVNLLIGDVFFLWMHPITDFIDLPIDANARVRIAFNVGAQWRA